MAILLKIKEWIYRFNPYLSVYWDASGYIDNVNFHGNKTDWSYTLLTKINEISAHIHMATLIGAADTIEINSFNLYLLKDTEYFNESNMRLLSKYEIIINDFIDKNIIIIYKKDVPKYLLPEKIHMTSGLVRIKNRA